MSWLWPSWLLLGLGLELEPGLGPGPKPCGFWWLRSAIDRHATAAFCRISRCVGLCRPPIILDLALSEEMTLLLVLFLPLPFALLRPRLLPPEREGPALSPSDPDPDSAFVGFSGDGMDGVYRAGPVGIDSGVGLGEDMIRFISPLPFLSISCCLSAPPRPGLSD